MGISQQLAASRLIQPGVCTSSTRPASPYEGQCIYETDTDRMYVWDGSAWSLTWMKTMPSFFATRTSNVTVSNSPNALVFDNSVVNDGSCYSTSNGRFTAPVTGKYWLSTTVLTQLDTNGCDIRFSKNGTIMSEYAGFSMTGSGNAHRQTEITGIVSLTANDYITVNPFSTSTIYVYGDTHGHTRFSGHLVI